MKSAIAIAIAVLGSAPAWAQSHIDYGPLGYPRARSLDQLPLKAKLRAIHTYERNGRVPGGSGVVTWSQLFDYQEALRSAYYIVLQTSPGSLTATDRRWIRYDEANIIVTGCENLVEQSGDDYGSLTKAYCESPAEAALRPVVMKAFK